MELTLAKAPQPQQKVLPKFHRPKPPLQRQDDRVVAIVRRSRLQPKLAIGAPNDRFEQEADRVADQVMRMPEPQLQRT